MSVYKILDKMEEMVRGGGSLPWPLNDRVVLFREQMVKLIERARETMPDEVKKAHWISQERRRIEQETTTEATRVVRQASTDADRLVREAEEKSREIVRAAREEAQRLVQENEITQKAREEARKLLAEARGQAERVAEESARVARETRDSADRYAAGILGGMEGELNRILGIIKRHQESLAKQQAASPEPASTEDTRPGRSPAGGSSEARRSILPEDSSELTGVVPRAGALVRRAAPGPLFGPRS